MQTFKKLLFLLTTHERKRACLLLLMILLMALLDMIGVASILPFMAVLTNPSLVDTNLFLNFLFTTSSVFGVSDNQQFLFILGLLVFIMIVVSLLFKAVTTYAMLRFMRMREYSIGKRLVEGYLNQPYSWFLDRNSAELGKNILSEVTQILANSIMPFMEIIAKGAVSIAIIILLITVDPKIALIVGFLFSGLYFLIFFSIKGYLNRIGNERLESNKSRFVVVNEAFGAAKEIKVSGLEKIYINLFSNPAYIFARTTASQGIIAQIPRFILESLAFGGILLIILYKMAQTGNFNSILPIFSLYIFAGYRLMPAIQQIYSSFTSLTFSAPALEKLYNDLKNLKPITLNEDKSILPLNKSINLKNIHYNYPNTSRVSLKNINLEIPAKSTVGFVGSTGSGKTTLVDIILGLLEAQKGTLKIDEKVITKENIRSWQRSIGYVPQHIYLKDDSIAANIAFGVSHENINQKMLERASKIANLHNFVIEELPNQYQTSVGERGVRLSGGQRQRIGIARALYNNPQVLILDEATSALDNETEKAVMDSVNNLRKDITIILIAHRLNTLKNCDIIFKLDRGQIARQGTFQELDKNNDFNQI
jgi:ABC-type multidrug transport system fused ATPase/permease subunit